MSLGLRVLDLVVEAVCVSEGDVVAELDSLREGKASAHAQTRPPVPVLQPPYPTSPDRSVEPSPLSATATPRLLQVPSASL